MIKKEDRAFLDESLRGHIAKCQAALYDAIEAVCLRGEQKDLVVYDELHHRYALLLKVHALLTDATVA